MTEKVTPKTDGHFWFRRQHMAWEIVRVKCVCGLLWVEFFDKNAVPIDYDEIKRGTFGPQLPNVPEYWETRE